MKLQIGLAQINTKLGVIKDNFEKHMQMIEKASGDGLNFWRGSTIYDPDGILVGQAPYHMEKLVNNKIDLNELHRIRVRLPLLRDERTAPIQREMKRILNNGGRGKR